MTDNPYYSYILVELFCIAFALNNLFRLRKGYNIGKEKPILMKIIVSFLVLASSDIVGAFASGEMILFPHYFIMFIYALSLIATAMGCYYWFQFVEVRIGRPVKHWLKILFDLPMIMLGILTVISIFTNWIFYADVQGVYQMGSLFIIQEVVACSYLVFSMISSFVELFRTKDVGKRKEYIAYIAFIMFNIASIDFEDAFPTIPLFELMILLSIQVLFFTVYLDTQYAYSQRERELAESRAAMMISQIQPHFIYNVLSVIRVMCKDKAPEAAETTAEFAAYLRGNLDSLSIKEPIPFAKELDHTANFIALEKRRFGDRINVNYDIQTDAFTIPALSLQPLVENSIKHGLLVKEEGGSITITAKEAENEYILTVQDDGVGFDAAAVQNDGQIHVGIDNVRKRLDFMCHGTLEIQSEIGQGTTSTIRIPKLSDAGK